MASSEGLESTPVIPTLNTYPLQQALVTAGSPPSCAPLALMGPPRGLGDPEALSWHSSPRERVSCRHPRPPVTTMLSPSTHGALQGPFPVEVTALAAKPRPDSCPLNENQACPQARLQLGANTAL